MAIIFRTLGWRLIGHHCHIAGVYLVGLAQGSAWRDDRRRTSNGDQITAVARLAMRNKPAVDFCDYWQRQLGA
ncbi:MAG TPA: hypothetical protein VN980_17770 [Alphaproteobacteria bacterium]|nr:hypothetical protein [Alphaproteobacteria bacterium]